MACVKCQQHNLKLKVTHGQEPKIQGPFEEHLQMDIYSDFIP